MSLYIVNEAVVEMNAKEYSFGEEERKFILEFAFKSQDKELTKQLMMELKHSNQNSEVVMKRFDALLDQKPTWLTQIENLLVALEMYRIEEEKAINRLLEIMRAYNIDISEDMLRSQPLDEVKERISNEISLKEEVGLCQNYKTQSRLSESHMTGLKLQ